MKKPWGIRAYGRDFRFRTRREYLKYLQDWMAKTEGSERERAVVAYIALSRGVKFTNSDYV